MIRNFGASVLFLALLALFLRPGDCRGAGLVVFSNPEGSSVDMAGPVKISGITPFEVPSTQTGLYRIRIEKSGFARSVGWLEL
ncbi:MAG: PEGA domain-containing protein, partial [Candidatus Eisenbacteria bacterium]